MDSALPLSLSLQHEEEEEEEGWRRRRRVVCGVGVVVGGGFPGRFQERVYTVIPPPLHIAYHLLRTEYPYGRMPYV